MERRSPADDELARRRASRHQGDGEGQPEEPLPEMGWKDIVAMTIAAYQILLPILLIIFAALGVVWLLFRFVFH